METIKIKNNSGLVVLNKNKIKYIIKNEDTYTVYTYNEPTTINVEQFNLLVKDNNFIKVTDNLLINKNEIILVRYVNDKIIIEVETKNKTTFIFDINKVKQNFIKLFL